MPNYSELIPLKIPLKITHVIINEFERNIQTVSLSVCLYSCRNLGSAEGVWPGRDVRVNSSAACRLIDISALFSAALYLGLRIGVRRVWTTHSEYTATAAWEDIGSMLRISAR